MAREEDSEEDGSEEEDEESDEEIKHDIASSSAVAEETKGNPLYCGAIRPGANSRGPQRVARGNRWQAPRIREPAPAAWVSGSHEEKGLGRGREEACGPNGSAS